MALLAVTRKKEELAYFSDLISDRNSNRSLDRFWIGITRTGEDSFKFDVPSGDMVQDGVRQRSLFTVPV